MTQLKATTPFKNFETKVLQTGKANSVLALAWRDLIKSPHPLAKTEKRFAKSLMPKKDAIDLLIARNPNAPRLLHFPCTYQQFDKLLESVSALTAEGVIFKGGKPIEPRLFDAFNLRPDDHKLLTDGVLADTVPGKDLFRHANGLLHGNTRQQTAAVEWVNATLATLKAPTPVAEPEPVAELSEREQVAAALAQANAEMEKALEQAAKAKARALELSARLNTIDGYKPVQQHATAAAN